MEHVVQCIARKPVSKHYFQIDANNFFSSESIYQMHVILIVLKLFIFLRSTYTGNNFLRVAIKNGPSEGSKRIGTKMHNSHYKNIWQVHLIRDGGG